MRRLLLAAALLAGAGAAAGAAPPAPDVSARFVSAGQRVEVAPGRGLNLVCMGSGDRTVLFDAGGSDWSVVWALVQPRIARRARACSYDRAGLGFSDPGPGPRSPIAIVEDLHRLIAAAGLKGPIVMVGHSLGGFNVKLHAALYPDDVAGLVLIDPAEERTWDRTRSWAVAGYGPVLAARSELLDQRFIAALAQRYRECALAAKPAGLDVAAPIYRRCTDPARPQLGPDIAAAREKIQVTAAYQDAQASEIASSVYGDSQADAVYRTLFHGHPFGARPLIVLTHAEAASADPLDELGREQGLVLHRETAALSRRGTHRLVSGAGHYIQLDRPDVVAAAIESVLDQLGR